MGGFLPCGVVGGCREQSSRSQVTGRMFDQVLRHGFNNLTADSHAGRDEKGGFCYDQESRIEVFAFKALASRGI